MAKQREETDFAQYVKFGKNTFEQLKDILTYKELKQEQMEDLTLATTNAPEFLIMPAKYEEFANNEIIKKQQKLDSECM